MSGNADVAGIGKVEAARRQLDTAINLFFDDGDSLSIHTLAQAAFRLLIDSYPHRRDDSFHKDLENVISQVGWSNLTHVPNFLKHADRDPLETLDRHSADEASPVIGFAAILHHRITGFMSPEMRGFDTWTHVMNPDVFELPPDEDSEFEAMFRRGIELMKNEERPTRLFMGKGLVQFFRENPDVGGFNARREPGWTDGPQPADP